VFENGFPTRPDNNQPHPLTTTGLVSARLVGRGNTTGPSGSAARGKGTVHVHWHLPDHDDPVARADHFSGGRTFPVARNHILCSDRPKDGCTCKTMTFHDETHDREQANAICRNVYGADLGGAQPQTAAC
jgi:hypothetical protein